MFIIFLVVPVLEGFAFYFVGSAIGGWWTVGLTFATTLVGLMWVQRQGLATLFEARQKLSLGEAPVTELYDGLCVAFAGILLVLPGFVTDCFGFALLLTPLRRLLLELGMDSVIGSMTFGMASSQDFKHASPPFTEQDEEDIIDADYEVVETSPTALKEK